MNVQILTVLLIGAIMSVAPAQDVPPERLQASAVLTLKNGGDRKVWLLSADENTLRYSEPPGGGQAVDISIKDIDSIYIEPPDVYDEVMDLYQGRKYEEAQVKFAEIKEKYKAIRSLPNNPGAMAGFYEMECWRKLGDYKKLSKALADFSKNSLPGEWYQRQLELYVLWDLVESKSWDQLEPLAKERETMKYSQEQRAQVAYLHGLALDGLKRPHEALLAYEMAITADAGASEVLVRDAALRALEIHHADPEIKDAIKAYDPVKGAPQTQGGIKLTEAAALANLFQLTLGAGVPLPEKFKYLLNYKLKPNEPKK